MTSRRQKASQKVPPRPAPQLYLVTPVIEDAAGFAKTLAAVLEAVPVAAVLLRLAPADERTQINRVKTLAPLVQEKGAALLLDNLPGIVARAGADGAHLSGIEAFLESVQSLKPERIAGIGRLDSRHDAMLAAEKGADYVMFGEPDEDGGRPAFSAICERVAWWAEVFETPCVGYAAQIDEIAPLVAAGADFIAVGDCLLADPNNVVAIMTEAAHMQAAETAS